MLLQISGPLHSCPFYAWFEGIVRQLRAGLLKKWNFSDLTWTAILSNSTSNAIDRVPILGPVYNTRGELVATDAADMWDGTIAHAIQYDEVGGGISSNFSVWTG